MEYIQIGNRRYPREQCVIVAGEWRLRKEIEEAARRHYTVKADKAELRGQTPMEWPGRT